MNPLLHRALIVACMLAAWQSPGARAEPAQTRSGAGVVFVVEGVGGFDLLTSAAQRALPRAGVEHEIRSFVWTHGRGKVFKDLQDTRNVLKKADELAALILKYKQENPKKPVYLMGKSGGAGLVLAAAECLPEKTLERVVLLSAAVAPTYDLRGALRTTRGEIISYHSIHDQVVLGWGTNQFGTVDRYYGHSAGLLGFEVPQHLSKEDHALYQRLVQVPWKPGMILEGHLGTHLGTSMPGFVGKEVAPWLKQ